VDFAFEAEQGGGGGQRYTVLACAGFGNHFFLTEFFGQQHFADAVVDFVGTGVVEVFAFEEDLRAAFGEGAGVVNGAGAADIGGLQAFHFADEIGIADDAVKAGFQFGQGLGKGGMADAAAVLAEVAVLIGKDEGG